MQQSTLAIETSGLTKAFAARRAVDHIDLAIPSGTIFGFLGPNGAGKTTTIRMLLGLIAPTDGTARILGHDIVRERAAIIPQVGAIVESPAFYPYLSGRDNLTVLARTAGIADKTRIDEVLALVDLSQRAGDKVRSYSLGMKQRLAIAAALLNDPRIIFLDEPTNGLDPAGTVEVRNLIKQLGQAGHTIFLSSHLLNEVEQVCSDIAIINQGRLVAQGTVAELLRTTSTLLVEADPMPILRSVAERFDPDAEQTGPQTVRVALAPDQAPKIVSALVSAGAHVFQITPQRATLEQRFLELTGTANHDASSIAQPHMNERSQRYDRAVAS